MFSLDYIIGLAGKRTVPIEIGSKYSDNDWSQKLMTIEEFIEKYIVNVKSHGIDDSGKSKGYLAQHPLFEQVNQQQPAAASLEWRKNKQTFLS